MPALIIFILIFLFFIFNILYFILPSLSPIPFFPTNKKDLSLIVSLLLSDELLRKKQKKKSNVKSQPRLNRGQMSNAVVDLGAGTGTVIFASAGSDAAATAQINYKKQYFRPSRGQSTPPRWRLLSKQPKFIAVEIHPLLIFIMHLRRLFHPNGKNIKIIRSDIFKMNINKTIEQLNNLTIYIYVGPFVMDRLIPRLQTLPKGTRIVSYMYEIPGWEKKLVKIVTGVNKIYIYQLS